MAEERQTAGAALFKERMSGGCRPNPRISAPDRAMIALLEDILLLVGFSSSGFTVILSGLPPKPSLP
jgi:hypothetical protein